VFNVPRVIARVNNPKNLRIFREVGIECVSSTTLIANLIEEEALLGSVSVVSSLTHGNVSLSEFTVGRMKHHSEDEGVAIADIEMPDGALIVAVAYEDDAEVARPEMLLYPGDQVIVVADIDVLDEVRAAFRAL
jgi:trk system potassium uptake protein TrkA